MQAVMELMPTWFVKLPGHIQSYIMIFVAMHLVAVLGLLGMQFFGKKGKADFQAKLK